MTSAMRTALVAGVVAIAAAPAALLGVSNVQASRSATAWLTQQAGPSMPAGQQADIITNRRITGASPASLKGALRALAPRAVAYATTAGATAKIVIAQRAAGASGPLAGRDFLASLDKQSRDGRYGSTAFDQCLSMIAMRVSGRKVPATAVTALESGRGENGWSFSLVPAEQADVDSTSMAVVALRAAGVPKTNPSVTRALAWLSTQRSGAGWTAFSGAAPSSDSTALVARAQVAAGASAAVGQAFLRAHQQRSGAIANTTTVPESRLLATIASVPPLAGISLANGFRRG